MHWIYSEDGVSVIIHENRSVTYNTVIEVYAMEPQPFPSPEKLLRNKILPHTVEVNFIRWQYELINDIIDQWIINNLEGKWGFYGVSCYRFEKATDAAFFKLVWA